MKRTWPIIGVKNVAASSNWYQALFGQSQREPHHDDFDQITDDDDTVLVCLHGWSSHGAGPPLESPEVVAPGNGVLLMFLVEDFGACAERARTLVAFFEVEPGPSEDGPWQTFTVRDPDGYYVSINSMQDIRALEAASA